MCPGDYNPIAGPSSTNAVNNARHIHYITEPHNKQMRRQVYRFRAITKHGRVLIYRANAITNLNQHAGYPSNAQAIKIKTLGSKSQMPERFLQQIAGSINHKCRAISITMLHRVTSLAR